MAHAFDAVPPRHDPREALQDVAQALLSSTGLAVEPAELDAAVETVLRRHGAPDPHRWPHVLDDLARSLGVRVSWRIAPWEDVADEVQPGLPLATWTPDGWHLCTRSTTPLVQRFPSAPTARALRSGDLPTGAVAWALLEPALPGAVLGGPGELSPVRRAMALLGAERRDLWLVLAYAAGVGVLGLATPVAVQVLVNTVAFGAFAQPLIAIAFMLFLCLALAALLKGLQRYVVEMLQRRVFVRMVADLSERLPRVKLSAYDANNGPELVNRFFDVLTVQKALSSLLMDGLSASLSALTGMVLLALYHPALLGFDVLLLFAIVGLLWGWSARATDTAVLESKKKYAVAGWLEEIAAHPTLYKLGGGSELAVRRADALARTWLDARQSHFRAFLTQYGGALALQAVANVVLLTVGGWLVIDGQLTLGQLVAAEFIVASVLNGFAKFSEKLETVYDLLAAADKLGQLVDLPLERSHGWRADPPEAPLALRVAGLSWDTPDGTTVFDDLTFHARPGERLLIVGDGGSGRSTLADLLLGMREAPRGRIAVDDLDLREIRLDTLRERVALARGHEHVSGTIADNVVLGRPQVSLDDTLGALDAVGLTNVVDGLPRGASTPLLASGAPLSDGQRARLAIARAIAPRPRLVVVDALLDTVDPDDRAAMLAALTPPDAPWTLVVLSRDASLAPHFTRTMRLEDGRCQPTGVEA